MLLQDATSVTKFNVQFGEPTNYGGFDKENWIPRTVEKHRQDVRKIASEVTKSKTEAAEVFLQSSGKHWITIYSPVVLKGVIAYRTSMMLPTFCASLSLALSSNCEVS